MKKRTLLLTMFLLALGLMLAACGGGTTPVAEPADAPAAEEPAAEEPAAEEPAAEAPAEEMSEVDPSQGLAPAGTVTLWHAYGTGSTEEATITKLVDNARAEFPEMTIEVLQLPFDQIFNRYQTEVAAGGTDPDMFIAPNDDLGNFARAGIVAPLDSYLEGRLEGVSEVAIEGMKVEGVLYGVPESAKAVALYYNTSLVDAPPTTMDELMTMVQEGEPGSVIVLNQNAYHSFPFFTAFGGELMDEEGRCIADQGGFTEALQYMAELKEAGALFETDGGRADTLFRSGEVAMIVNGPWALGDYRQDLGENLGVAPVPAGSAPAAALNGIDGFYINPNSDNMDAAVELALYLTGTDSAIIYTNEAGHAPIRTDVTAEDPLVQGFADASAQGYPRPQSEQFANYWGPFGDAVTKVMEGVETPEEAVANACQAMNEASGL